MLFYNSVISFTIIYNVQEKGKVSAVRYFLELNNEDMFQVARNILQQKLLFTRCITI